MEEKIVKLGNQSDGRELSKKCALHVVRNSFLCDVCGEEKTGEKYKMYNENWNFEGCYECADCFDEKMRGQIGEY